MHNLQATLAPLHQLFPTPFLFVLNVDGAPWIIDRIIALLLIARWFLMDLLARVVILIARC